MGRALFRYYSLYLERENTGIEGHLDRSYCQTANLGCNWQGKNFGFCLYADEVHHPVIYFPSPNHINPPITVQDIPLANQKYGIAFSGAA